MEDPSKVLQLDAHRKAQEDSDELARFREEWKAEVERKKHSSPGSSSTLAQPGEAKVSPTRTVDRRLSTRAERRPTIIGSPSTPTPSATTPIHPGIIDGVVVASAGVSTGLESALRYYRRAVHSEQQGALDSALSLYRQAFRLVCIHPITLSQRGANSVQGPTCRPGIP